MLQPGASKRINLMPLQYSRAVRYLQIDGQYANVAIFNGIGLKRGVDSTQPTDYDVEVELPEEVGQEALR